MEEILWNMNPWWDSGEVPKKLYGTKREIYISQLKKFTGKKVIILIGPRRSGKTTLMLQLIADKLKSGIKPNRILYAELDHPLLASINDVITTFRKIHGIKRQDKIYLFLDEIQYIVDWSRWVKALYDNENTEIIVSGSSTTMLKPETATYLTGRNYKVDIWPLSFKEFVDFRGRPAKSESYIYSKYLDDYFYTGGYPEVVLEDDKSVRQRDLASYFEDMIDRDVVRVYGVREIHAIRELATYLMENIAQIISMNKISKVLKLPLSTLREYLTFLEGAYILFSLPYYSKSINEIRYNPKKYYSIDLGLRYAITGRTNLGPIAENTLFLHLIQNYQGIYYWKQKYELDFIMDKGSKIVECKYHDDIDKSSYKGLIKFMEINKIKFGQIVSKSIADQIKSNGKTIDIIPMWKYLLEFKS